jgi:hypothetical protein
MKNCTVGIVDGFVGKKQYAIQTLGTGGSSHTVGLFGYAEGANAKKNKQDADFFAAAPAMHDMLVHLVKELGNVNPDFPLSAGKVAEISLFVERASKLVDSIKY